MISRITELVLQKKLSLKMEGNKRASFVQSFIRFIKGNMAHRE